MVATGPQVGCLAFSRDADAFSAPHSVRQLNATSLLVLDDGNNREGCSHYTACVRGLLLVARRPRGIVFDRDAAQRVSSDVQPTTLARHTRRLDCRYAGCFSRAVLYDLDFEKLEASIAWQFEAPLSLPGDSAAAPFSREAWHDAMTHDEYNFDGGSVHPLPSGTVLTAFTAT